ncbi:MAG TPA: hypothetical protein VKX45_06675 [Bryobacteraceae bacterium]|jgi:hypothetical protein|nr:hypothetical protein [Bryobacteraceae bacterium]
MGKYLAFAETRQFPTLLDAVIHNSDLQGSGRSDLSTARRLFGPSARKWRRCT